MSINISNKKYAILEEPIVKKQQKVANQNGNVVPDEGFVLDLVRVQVPEPIFESVTINPSTTVQTILPSTTVDGINKVVVKKVTSSIDSNIKPQNIVDGVEILGVTGEFKYILENVTITPSTTAQTITPSGTTDGYNKVIVKKVTSSIDSNIKAKNILTGVTILGVTGNVIPSNEETIDITENGFYTPPAQYTGFSEVSVDVKAKHVPLTIAPSTTLQSFTSLDEYHGYMPVIAEPVTSDIDSDILSKNILDGVDILGVTGKIVLDNITIEPTTTTQIINHPQKEQVDGGYNSIKVNPVTAAIDSDIKPENIRKDINILGVTGNIIELLGQTTTIEPSTTTETYTPTNGRNGFTSVKVNAVTSSIDSDIKSVNIRKGVNILGVDGSIDFETITISPTTSQQVFTPTKDGYSKVTVEEVTSAIDSDIKAENIRNGINILGVTGNIIELKGTTLEVVPTTQDQQLTPPNGFNGFTTVTISGVDSGIDPNLTPTNIKNGVSILGVTGNVIELKGETKTITANGTYTPSNGKNGFTSVEVDVDTVNNRGLTISPSTTSQSFVVSSPYTGYNNIIANPVTSAIDSDIKAGNIKQGVDILGVVGTCVELNGETRTVSVTSTSGNTFTPSSGKNAITSIKVNPTNQNLTVTPATTAQTFNVPTNYSGYGTVKVNATPLQTKTITVDSTTATTVTVTPDNTYVGLSSVKFDMSWIETQLQNLNAGDSSTSPVNLQNKTVHSAGTYTCDDGYDGLGVVTVNLDWVAQAIEQAKEGTPTGDCDGLIDNTAIEIVTDADYVRQYAFYKSTNLKRVFLNNASGIQQYAFADSGLQDLIINTDTMCALQPHAFDNAPLSNIFVPSALVATYQADSEWSTYSSIIQAIA